MEYLTHITKNGDRWDLLAYKYYGKAFAVEFLLDANPAHAKQTILPSGIKLIIPVLSQEQLNPEQESVVAWR